MAPRGAPVVHVEIVGRDPARLRAFFRDAFAWQFDAPLAGPGGEPYALAAPSGDGGIKVGVGGGGAAYAGHATFYVAVADLDAAVARVEACGGSVVMPPTQIPDGPKIALVRDPEEHVIGLLEGVSEPAA